MEPLAYTVDEAIQVAKVGRTLIYEHIGAGALPVIKLGRKTLIPAAGLRDWLAANTTTSPKLADPPRRPGRPQKVAV